MVATAQALPSAISTAAKRRSMLAAAMRATALRSSPGSAVFVIAFTDRASSLRASVRLQVELAQLLAQGVAVEAQQLGRPDLVAPRCLQRQRQQRPFHLAQDPVIEAACRQAMRMRLEIAVDMPL